MTEILHILGQYKVLSFIVFIMSRGLIVLRVMLLSKQIVATAKHKAVNNNQVIQSMRSKLRLIWLNIPEYS